MDCLILYEAASPPTEALARAMADSLPGSDVTVLDLDHSGPARCDLLIVGAGVRGRPGLWWRGRAGFPESDGSSRTDVRGTVSALTVRGVQAHWYGAFDTRPWSILPRVGSLADRLDTALFRQGLRPALPARSFPLATVAAPSSAELIDAAAWAGELYAVTRARLRVLARVVRPSA
ncbi:hypothetical protein ACFJGV_01665 [Cnuibacter sp. UC19_7]|uniref:hypothetical protein n=1 Tax=Cnuibacter sp. UC19_7 TaxID=3350166 RepID=UPI00367094AD